MAIVFAIIQTGGRQVKVNQGSMVTVDRVEAEVGKEITFDQVLFIEKDGGEMLAGAPFVANARVIGIVDGESRGPKIRVFRKKRRKGFRKTRGHRATYTRVRVTDIVGLQSTISNQQSPISNHHGSQKRSGQFPQRARQQLAASWRQAPRR
jgi:large subunit ribosomal protein L21